MEAAGFALGVVPLQFTLQSEEASLPWIFLPRKFSQSRNSTMFLTRSFWPGGKLFSTIATSLKTLKIPQTPKLVTIIRSTYFSKAHLVPVRCNGHCFSCFHFHIFYIFLTSLINPEHFLSYKLPQPSLLYFSGPFLLTCGSLGARMKLLLNWFSWCSAKVGFLFTDLRKPFACLRKKENCPLKTFCSLREWSVTIFPWQSTRWAYSSI